MREGHLHESMDPAGAQARVQLTGHLFKECMRGVTDAFRMTGHAPIRPDEKEALFAHVEKAVWNLPEDVFEAASQEGWEEAAGDDERVRTALEDAMEPVLVARRESASPPS